MGHALNKFVVRYTWLLPLLVMIGATLYYINWFERLFAEDEIAYYLPIYKELQVSIVVLVITTALLNWALIGLWRQLWAGNCTPRWEKMNARK